MLFALRMVRKFSFKVKHCNLTSCNNATVAYDTAVRRCLNPCFAIDSLTWLLLIS